jgi:hypothetical protein
VFHETADASSLPEIVLGSSKLTDVKTLTGGS